MEEVKGGAEAAVDAASEEARTTVDDVAEIVAVDVGLPEEKGNGGPHDGFERGGQDFGAHGKSTAEIRGGEAEGVEELDEGLNLGERDA